MINRKKDRYAPYRAEIVFRPALTPLEAAVLPAREKRGYGAMKMAARRFDWDAPGDKAPGYRQRTKIWVR